MSARLTEADYDLIVSVLTTAEPGPPGEVPDRAAAQLYAAFSPRGAELLTAAARWADELWSRLRPAPLTDAELDRLIELKRKGFGNWSRDDLVFLAPIEERHPHVCDLLYPTPISVEPPSE